MELQTFRIPEIPNDKVVLLNISKSYNADENTPPMFVRENDYEMTRKYCRLNEQCKAMLERCFEQLDLSARAYDKILRVARTIADLDKSETIELQHITEAVQYRSLDRKFWRTEE